jgi:hypothetical protein
MENPKERSSRVTTSAWCRVCPNLYDPLLPEPDRPLGAPRRRRRSWAPEAVVKHSSSRTT